MIAIELTAADRLRLEATIRFLGDRHPRRSFSLVRVWAHNRIRYCAIRSEGPGGWSCESITLPVSSPVAVAAALALLFFSLGKWQ